jgi:hypothetical protein
MTVFGILDEIRTLISASPHASTVKDKIKAHLESLRDDLVDLKPENVVKKKLKDTKVMTYLNRLEGRIKSITYETWADFNNSTRMIYAQLIDSISDLTTNGVIGATVHNNIMDDLQALYKGKGEFVADKVASKITELKMHISELLEDVQ